jgi:hypothetical protein
MFLFTQSTGDVVITVVNEKTTLGKLMFKGTVSRDFLIRFMMLIN